MKFINNTNTTITALTVRKNTSLTVVHNFKVKIVRVSAKAIFSTIALTLLNFVI